MEKEIKESHEDSQTTNKEPADDKFENLVFCQNC